MKLFNPWVDLDSSNIPVMVLQILWLILLIVIVVFTYWIPDRRQTKFHKLCILIGMPLFDLLLVIMFYWHVAILISTIFSTMVYLLMAHDYKRQHEEELQGATGLNQKYRDKQKTQFGKMSDDEKKEWIEYYSTHEIKINVPVSVLISTMTTIAVIVLLHILDIGYLL